MQVLNYKHKQTDMLVYRPSSEPHAHTKRCFGCDMTCLSNCDYYFIYPHIPTTCFQHVSHPICERIKKPTIDKKNKIK